MFRSEFWEHLLRWRCSFVPTGPCARWLSFAPLLMAGCGGPAATLDGVVRINGEPLAAAGEVKGTLVFQPEGSGTPAATATVGPDGAYGAMIGNEFGITPGDYKVAIRAIRTMPPSSSAEYAGADWLIDRKYSSPNSSGLTVSVAPGSNSFDIDIPSKKL